MILLLITQAGHTVAAAAAAAAADADIISSGREVERRNTHLHSAPLVVIANNVKRWKASAAASAVLPSRRR